MIISHSLIIQVSSDVLSWPNSSKSKEKVSGCISFTSALKVYNKS